MAGVSLPAIPGASARSVAMMAHALTLSSYVESAVEGEPALVAELCASGDLEAEYPDQHLARRVAELLKLPDAKQFGAALRQLRRREMLRIIIRDFNRVSDLDATTGDLSDLADACIDTALDYHLGEAKNRYGAPTTAAGAPMSLAVLALGKLGARELNLSSDVDLVFFYAEPGSLRYGHEREITYQEFFLKVARQLIATLSETTRDGFVFRVDMRLRPYGESSALVLHRDAMDKYYLEQGRDWERYAFIKARANAGDRQAGQAFLDWLKPFIYRRHLDYGAIESLREMKAMINRQVELASLEDDLKLGPGGIREVEFIAQAHQLIFGGHDADLQVSELQRVLQVLADSEYLPAEDVSALQQAYVFLRNAEHALQGEADRQTQLLPGDERLQERLALTLGFPGWPEFVTQLTVHRTRVSECFDKLMDRSDSEVEALREVNLLWAQCWRSPASAMAREHLMSTGFPESAAATLEEFAALLQEQQALARERVDRLMPALLALISRQADSGTTLSRVLPVLQAILRRSTYLAFLNEDHEALQRLVLLCAMSPWVAEQLLSLPILLYELSERHSNEAALRQDQLAQQLHHMLLSTPVDDEEAQMDTLRQFKAGAVLRVAMFELLDILPVMKASDALTNIAEVVLEKVLAISWQQLSARHGEPCDTQGAPVPRQFGIIAYGKLGGIELAYGSDLDLVFLFDTESQGDTNGARSVNNNVFHFRLVQRIVHMLTAFTRLGALYEIDMRLRPAGNKGAVATTTRGYRRYLENDAWTWEHQALIRARFVAGDDSIAEAFAAIRRDVLSRPTRPDLREDVRAMRDRMLAHLGSQQRLDERSLSSGQFDLKQDPGTIVDIEFMVQYAVLSHCHAQPALIEWTDKMRLLDSLSANGVLDEQEARTLQQAYLAFRALVHYRWLGGDVEAADDIAGHREVVVELWQKYLGTN